VLHESRSGSAGEWIRQFVQAEEMLPHHDLLAKVDNDPRLKRRIDMFLDGVTELVMYSELANHAVSHKWTTFPEILDPHDTGRPVLSIVDGHAPRVWADSQEEGGAESVPNTLELGVDPEQRNALISGPNGLGKTTSMRMASQLVTLAQMYL